jgi:hypothetical protein
MALTLTATIRLQALLTKVLGDQTLSQLIDVNPSFGWVSGVLVNQADKVYYAKPTIGGSATLSLDFVGGLLDIYGDPFTPARLKLLAVLNDVANPNAIQVQRPASNGIPLFMAVSDGLALNPGGGLVWWDASATAVVITPTSADLLSIVNTAAGNVVPTILAIGASA